MISNGWQHVLGMTLTGAIVAGVAGSVVELGTVGFVAGAFGGYVGGAATIRFFGRSGWQGWAISIATGLLATIGGAVTGAVPVWLLFGSDGFGGIWEIAAFALLLVVFNSTSIVVWLAAMIALHLRAQRQNRST